MNILNEIFDKVIVLTTPKRADRRKKLDEQMNKLGIEYSYHFNKPGNPWAYHKFLRPGEISHLLGTIDILKEVQINKWEKTLILEDDVVFISDFDFLFYEYYQQVPKWDLLYLSGNHNEVSKTGKKDHLINKNILKSLYTLTTAAYAVTLNAAIKIEKELSGPENCVWVEWKDLKQTDLMLANMTDRGDLTAYSFYPSLITQADDFSDIQESFVSYKELIK